MTITVSGTTLTFNDSTTMTTAATGTVTSVATGNGLSGGTITSSGTLTVACPTFNTVGSYTYGVVRTTSGNQNWSSGDNMAAGTSNKNVQNCFVTLNGCGGYEPTGVNELSGTWKVLFKGASVPAAYNFGLLCRVS